MKNCIKILFAAFLSIMVSMTSFAQIDTLCFGSTLETYSITPNLGSNYFWSVSGGGVIVGSNTGTSIQVDWSNASLGLINNAITLTEELNGCEADQTLSVEILENPIPNLSASDLSICLGQSVLFSTDSDYDTYNWTPSSLSGPSPTYTPNAITDDTFVVEVIGEGGCSTTESIEIEIFELPSVEVSLSDSTICLGESITVSATSGFITYTWTNSSLFSDQTTLTPALGDTEYSVSIIDANGCEASDDVTLIINEISPIELLVNGSETTTICIGETISLDATDGFSSYDWVPDVVIGDNGDYVPQNTSETSYTVTSTDSEGCQSVDTINITINNLPNPGPIIFN
tara:strand:+ start:739 stop:1770 length:1032 start_codon:yes stop_codon:yes gene_type:complete